MMKPARIGDLQNQNRQPGNPTYSSCSWVKECVCIHRSFHISASIGIKHLKTPLFNTCIDYRQAVAKWSFSFFSLWFYVRLVHKLNLVQFANMYWGWSDSMMKKHTESNAVSNVETMWGNISDGSTKASRQAELPTVLAKLPFLLYCPRSISRISVPTNAALSDGPSSKPVLYITLHKHHTRFQWFITLVGKIISF